MNRRTLSVLIALNIAISAALAGTFFMPAQDAEAQAFGTTKRSFTMIAGQATGRPQNSVIYVIDANSGDMVATFYNSATNTFEGLGARSVAEDMRAVMTQ